MSRNNGNWSYESYEASVKCVRELLEKIRNKEFPKRSGEFDRYVVWGSPREGWAIEMPAQVAEQATEGFDDVIEEVVIKVGYHFLESAFIYILKSKD